MTEHEQALAQHDHAYEDMRRMRGQHGRDSDEYRQALEDVRSAAAECGAAARRAAEPQRKTCPTCNGTGKVRT